MVFTVGIPERGTRSRGRARWSSPFQEPSRWIPRQSPTLPRSGRRSATARGAGPAACRRCFDGENAVDLTLKYLVSPMERAETAHTSPNFLFHTAQLRELAHAMLRAADKVEPGGYPQLPSAPN